jgi:fatty-acyl-CoA synthase
MTSQARRRQFPTFVRPENGARDAPKSVDFVETIPLSPLGMIGRKAVRSAYWRAQERLVN